MEQRVTLRRAIGREEQGLFLEVPFLVPERAERLSVRCSVDAGGEAATLDLGVRDTARVRGWSGGARTEYYVSETEATPGYVPGEMPAGGWAVLLGAYRIPPAGCVVTLEVAIETRQARWLRGDLHGHTVHSDGSYELGEVAELARAAGLDFVALTDHNTHSQNSAYPRGAGLIFIPGMEFTTYRGHANLLGVPDPLPDFRATTAAEVRARLDEARRAGARIVLNHPHDGELGWHWGWDAPHDWVEVWNAPWRECNERALEWWHSRLVSGERVVAVGGSDTHRPHPHVRHGVPTTWVYAEGRTVADILNAMDRGHVSLSCAPDGPFLRLSCGQYMAGDVVPDDAGMAQRDVVLRGEGLVEGDVVRMLSDKGTEQERSVHGEGALEVAWPAGERHFYRAEIRRRSPGVRQSLVAALTNPLYLGAR